MCERRIQGAEEVGILADSCLHVMKNGVFQNAVFTPLEIPELFKI